MIKVMEQYKEVVGEIKFFFFVDKEFNQLDILKSTFLS